MLGLGIIYADKHYTNRIKKVFKNDGADLSELAFFAITLTNEVDGQRLPQPRYYIIGYDMNGNKIGAIPRMVVFPEGWNKKEPLWERLFGKVKFSNLFKNA